MNKASNKNTQHGGDDNGYDMNSWFNPGVHESLGGRVVADQVVDVLQYTGGAVQDLGIQLEGRYGLQLPATQEGSARAVGANVINSLANQSHSDTDITGRVRQIAANRVQTAIGGMNLASQETIVVSDDPRADSDEVAAAREQVIASFANRAGQKPYADAEIN